MVGTGIAMMIVSIATKIYTDTGGPGLTIYRPHCPPGFCILGDYAQEGDIAKPNHGVMLCILMQQNSTVIAEAQGFAQVWSSEGPESGHGYGDDEGPETIEGSSGSASGQNDILAFWRPIGPNEDYVALGHVATTSYEPPSYDHVCVVHKSAAIAGIPGRRVWIEESRMASLWSMALSYHYLNLGMFFSSDSKAAPRITQFWSLLSEVVPAPQNTSLSIKKLTKDDLTLIYKGQECRTSKILGVYLPRAPIGYAPLGHYAERGFSRASQVTPMLVVKEMGGKGLLRHPVTFQELWRSDANNTDAAIWRPVPPPGYFCVGHVLGVGSEAPPTNSTECLHWSVIGRGWPSRSKRVWWNKCSPGRDATIWRVSGLDDCLSAGTFVIHRGLHNPHWEELLFHCFYLNEVSVR